MLQIQPAQVEGEDGLSLLGDLTIYSAAEARGDLAGHQARGAGLVLDLSGVDEVDTAGVQVLLWLKREGRNRDKALRLVNHSAAVVEAFDLLQVAGVFGDPILIAPTGA
jgi:anti-sigma B factor antagonist